MCVHAYITGETRLKTVHVKSCPHTILRISKSRFLPFSDFLQKDTSVAIVFAEIGVFDKNDVFDDFDQNVQNTGYRQVKYTPFWDLF